jgi:hypothetical protein
MPIGTQEERASYWENKDKYIGQFGTVKYYGWTDEGRPFQPIFERVKTNLD